MALNINKGSKLGKYFYQKDSVTYGPITVDELLERVNADTMVYYDGASWAKAKDLPELSKFFKNQQKPTSTDPKVIQKPTAAKQEPIKSNTPAPTTAPVESIKKEVVNQSGNGKKFAVALVLLLLTTGIIGYFLWYKPYIRDKNAARMYSFATSLALRSSQVSGVDYNTIGNILYGSEVLVYSNSGEWSQCKANNQEGYAASKFLLSKQDFHILNGIFADQDSRDAVVTTKCKKALLNYYNSKGYIGKIDEQLQMEIFDSTLQREVWQIFAKNKDIKPNAVAYQRVVNPTSKFTDFACIITNIQTNKRKFLLFSFNELEEAKLELEQDAPDYGYIDKVYKTNNGEITNYFVTYAN